MKGEYMQDSTITESEYQGKPVFVIKRAEGDKYPFTFGIRKAELILAHVEEIRAFVQRHAE